MSGEPALKPVLKYELGTYRNTVSSCIKVDILLYFSVVDSGCLSRTRIRNKEFRYMFSVADSHHFESAGWIRILIFI